MIERILFSYFISGILSLFFLTMFDLIPDCKKIWKQMIIEILFIIIWPLVWLYWIIIREFIEIPIKNYFYNKRKKSSRI